MALKDWVRWDKNRYHNKKLDKTIVLQEGTNKMFILNWKTNKRQEVTGHAPNRKALISFAKSYMRRH